jgi:hypothetical protein
MALQNGFKIIDIDVQDGGGGFGSSTSYNLFARDSSGQGSGLVEQHLLIQLVLSIQHQFLTKG